MAQYSQNIVFSGLGTISVTAPADGDYFLNAQISLPTLTNGGGVSAVVAVINVNGSPVYTGVAGATGAQAKFSVTSGQAIALVLSSSAAPDLQLNAVKTTIAIGQGV